MEIRPLDKEIYAGRIYAYSNTDPEQHEVRIEMGKKL